MGSKIKTNMTLSSALVRPMLRHGKRCIGAPIPHSSRMRVDGSKGRMPRTP